jgi:hypothetical protein
LRKFGKRASAANPSAGTAQVAEAKTSVTVQDRVLERDMIAPQAKKILNDNVKEFLKNPSAELCREVAVSLRNARFPEEFRPELVKWAISSSLDYSSMEQDWVASLLIEMREQIPVVISSKEFARGLQLTVERLPDLEIDCPAAKKIVSHMAKACMVKNCWGEADEEGTTFSTTLGLKAAASETAAEGEGVMGDKNAVLALLDSGKKGVELVNMYKVAQGSIDPSELLLEILRRAMPLDQICVWAEPAEYGAVLEHALYNAAPAVHLKTFKYIIKVLEESEFPLADMAQNKEGGPKFKYISEAIFHALYDEEILPGAAFLAWRSSMDVYEGKMKVLIQVTKYVNHVEQNENESSEEESSEEDDDM